ncbi:uncharacterized protein [Amphiura filiformis]|uniref:uncharacterized protein n=1 Tax=Amphiura filiformis TaxID=82378 RepID=UPI003B21B605
MSTQAFSPELTQETPYLSQNDFRSPIELSGVKGKQGRGRGKKATEKKSKSVGRGKGKTQSDVGQDDDSLSDVEIMRDANTSSSSVKDKYGTTLALDGGNPFNEAEMHKLSEITTKLTQTRVQLEKFLNPEEKRQPFDRYSGNRSLTYSKKSNSGKEKTEKKSDDLSKSYTPGKNEVSRAKVFSNFIKPPVDPALLKFPTRVGPIPTPDALEEESKKMQKRSQKPSPTRPFYWDESEEEERNKQPREQVKSTERNKRNVSTLANRAQCDADQSEYAIASYSDEDGSKKRSKTKGRKQKNEYQDESDSPPFDVYEDEEDTDTEICVQKSVPKAKTNKRPEEVERSTRKQKDDKYNDSDIEEELNTEKHVEKSNDVEQKAKRRGNQKKWGRRNSLTDAEIIDRQESIKPPLKEIVKGLKKIVKGRGKQPKQDIKKTLKDYSTDEESENGEMPDNCHKDNKITSTKSQKEKKKGREKQKKPDVRETPEEYSTEEFENGQMQDYLHSDNEMTSAKPQKEKKSREKQKKQGARKMPKDYSTEEESENEEMPDNLHSDNEITNTKPQKETKKSREKQKKQDVRETPEEYSTEEFENGQIQDNLHSDNEIANTKPQKEKKKSREKQKKPEPRKTSKYYSPEEEYENGEMQDNLHSDNEIQAIKPQKQKVKSRGKQKKQEAKKILNNTSSTEDESEFGELQDHLHSNDEIQSKPTKTRQQKTKSTNKPCMIAAESNNQQQEILSNGKRQKKDNESRKFSSQIEDADSGETAEEQSKDGDQDEEFDRNTVCSVETFHSLCQKLLEHSGDGIGATRSRRHLPKVNYKDPENSEIDLSLSGSSVSSAPSTSHRNVSKTKTLKDAGEISLPTMPKRSKLDDTQSVISNRSWLIEKTKQKVSTYSKNRAQQWIGVGPLVNLDTVSAKKKPKPKARPTKAVSQKTPPALPKKPKRPHPQSDEEDGAYIYYYREEDMSSRKGENKNDQPTNKKKPKYTDANMQGKRQQDVEEEELDDLETMRSQQSRHNTTPISSALLDYHTTGCDDVDLYPMTPASLMPDDEEMTLSQLSIAITPRRDSTPSSGRTPKLVTFEDDKISVEQDVNIDECLLLSGPVIGPRPRKSALKRKYPDMSEESGDEASLASDNEEDGQEQLSLSQGQGMLKPKIYSEQLLPVLFK